MIDFGERLRMYRKRAGQSQMAISKLTEISQTTISDWENNKTEPMISDIFALARVFGISVSELLEDEKRKSVKD